MFTQASLNWPITKVYSTMLIFMLIPMFSHCSFSPIYYSNIGKVIQKWEVKTTCKISQILSFKTNWILVRVVRYTLVKQVIQLKNVWAIKCFKTIILSKSAVAEHQREIGHQIIFDNTISVVTKAGNYVQLRGNPVKISHEGGYLLPSVWNTPSYSNKFVFR